MSLAVIIDAIISVGLVALLISAVFVFLIFRLDFVKKYNKLYILIFVNYIVYVLWFTIFSRDLNIYPKRISIELYFLHTDWYSILQIIQNILLTIPFGYLSKYFASIRKSLILTLLFSVTIESTQLILGCGTFQIDDIILNLIGGVIGVSLYLLFYKVKALILSNRLFQSSFAREDKDK